MMFLRVKRYADSDDESAPSMHLNGDEVQSVEAHDLPGKSLIIAKSGESYVADSQEALRLVEAEQGEVVPAEPGFAVIHSRGYKILASHVIAWRIQGNKCNPIVPGGLPRGEWFVATPKGSVLTRDPYVPTDAGAAAEEPIEEWHARQCLKWGRYLGLFKQPEFVNADEIKDPVGLDHPQREEIVAQEFAALLERLDDPLAP